MKRKQPHNPAGKLTYLVFIILAVFAILLAVSVACSGCAPKHGCKAVSGKNYKVGYGPK